jgi:hypothetical protein
MLWTDIFVVVPLVTVMVLVFVYGFFDFLYEHGFECPRCGSSFDNKRALDEQMKKEAGDIPSAA